MANRPEFQAQQSFWGLSTQPRKIATGITLSGGRTRPSRFYLGAGSTVPYVELVGSGASAKQFTWGEVIEILPGTTVGVRNASKHTGDIQIQSGDFPCQRPKRVTVPFPFTLAEDSPPVAFWFANEYIDTRLARQAYVSFAPVEVQTMDFLASIFGYYSEHTSNRDIYNFPFIPNTPPPSWAAFQQMEIPGYVNYFPLGQNTMLTEWDSMIPHTLPDFMYIGIGMQSGQEILQSFVTLEY